MYIYCVCAPLCVCTSLVTNNILVVLQGKIQWSRLGTRYMYFLNDKHLMFLAGDRRQQGGLLSFSFKMLRNKPISIHYWLPSCLSVLQLGEKMWKSGRHVDEVQFNGNDFTIKHGKYSLPGKSVWIITFGLAAPSRPKDPKEDGVEAERMRGFHQRPKCIDIASALISVFFVC